MVDSPRPSSPGSQSQLGHLELVVDNIRAARDKAARALWVLENVDCGLVGDDLLVAQRGAARELRLIEVNLRSLGARVEALRESRSA